MKFLRLTLAYSVALVALCFSAITLALAAFSHWLQDDETA